MNVFLLSYRTDKGKTKHKVKTLLRSRSDLEAAALAEDPGSVPSSQGSSQPQVTPAPGEPTPPPGNVGTANIHNQE